MPFVIPTAPPKQTTGGGGFRVAGASITEQPPNWKPDVLAAVAPKQRTVDWMGERGLPIVDQFTHDNGYRSDVISYPAPTEKDPNNRILLAPAAVPKRPSKRDEWLYGKEGYDAWLEKNGHRYRPSILEKDPATGKYRITGTYQPATKRDTGETPAQTADVPEVEAFARNRETLELLKGRNPEKFASAMKDYENYLAAKQRSPRLALPLAKKAMDQFKEIMPEGGYDRWVSERKQVERGDSNPPLALNKAGSDQRPTAFVPSETRGDYATNLGIPVESLLQNEDAAARKKFQESQVSDSPMGRFGQSFATGVESVSSGLNRILNPFVSNETLDEVGRNRQAFRDVVQDKGGFVGDVMNKAADSTGTMAAGAAVGAVTGGTGTLMALAAGIAQYDDAYREATDAGLRGEQRTQYAMAQAGWEAGTSLVFTKALKIPGVEGAFARGAVGGKTFGEILKRVAVQSGVSGVEEIPEEVSTAIGQNLTAKLSGVDPERAIITGEELTDIITQSFVQSGMMTGARNAPDMARSLKPGQQQTAPGDQPAAAAAGAAGPTPQQGPPALPILPPPSAATTDTTDFIPADLEGANNVNGLAQASPQVPWSNQIIRPQVLPAETNGNTAELPIARLAGETKGGGETPTPEPTKADPLRKLQPLPTTSDQAAVWAIENPELVKRVAEATKSGQPLTRAMMDSLGLKRGNSEQRAAFVKALFPEQTQGTTDASKTPSPAETQVLPPEPAAASTPEAVTVTTTHPAETVANKFSQESLRQSKIGGLRGRVKELMDSGMSREDAADQASRESREALESLDASLEDGDTIVIEQVYEDDGSVASSQERVIEDQANGKLALKKDESGNVIESDSRNFIPGSLSSILANLSSREPGGRRTFSRLRVKRRASDSRKATSPAPEAVTKPAKSIPRTARMALSDYTIRNRYHDKKRFQKRDDDKVYQRLKAAADAERRAESAQQETMTKREKEAERAQAQQEIAAGNVNRDNVKYALLHEVDPELRSRIQDEAHRLLGETESAETATALNKIIKDAGADTGAKVENEKERIVKILTGELDQRTNPAKQRGEDKRPPDPIVQLLLTPQAERGTTIAAAQRSVADGNLDGLAEYARDQVETDLNKDTTLDDPYVRASEEQILDKLGEVADLVGATMPEGDTGFDFGNANEPQAEPLGIESLKRAFKLSDDQAEAVNALADAIGLDVKKIAVAAGGQPGPDALDQAAYHGTPHTVDKFSTKHVGTGEGAQAYGWGLYFAGNKEVARWYKDKLAKKNSVEDLRENIETAFGFEYPDEAIENYREYFTDDQWPVVVELQKNDWLGFDHPLLSIRQAFHHLDDFDPSPELREAIKEFRRKTDGKLYQVDLKPAEDEYLLWDRPLSEQSEKVRKALIDAGLMSQDENSDQSRVVNEYMRLREGKKLPPNLLSWADFAKDRLGIDKDAAMKIWRRLSDGGLPKIGESLYMSLAKERGGRSDGEKAASEYLKSLGIRGIKYLDGTSRSQGEGSHNYVIFDDADVEITNVLYQGRNGAVEFTKDGTAIIRGFESANVSTGVHEIAHVARRQLLNRSVAPENRAGITDEDIAAAEQWAGVKDGEWSKEAEEKFARGFERYLTEAAAPNPALKTLFAKLSDWLRSVYKSITGSPIDVHISRAMQTVFDRLVTRSERVKVDSPFTLKRESGKATGPQKFDNAEGEQRRMFSGMDALPGQEDLFDGLDKPAEAGQGFQSQDSAEPSRKGPNPFRKNTQESSAKAAASTETSAGQSARRPNPFGKVPRATRSNASEASAEPSKRPDGSNARPYGGGLEASAAGKLGPRVLKPLPMPELIHLARELLGKLPQIRKRMGAAFGRFQYKPGTRFMDIFIRADLPQNEQDVAETLAHEIGHLIDYLPDLQMGRGNILGRIASLRNYMKEFMAGKEGGPGPLTADDEKRLREEAKKLASTTAEIEIDEEIRQTMPITPADVLAVWNSLDTSNLSPELIAYIKRASAAEKKSIIRQAAKGIVADQLKQFATEVVTKTGKKIKQTVPGKTSAADIKAKLEELVAEEIRKRELLSRKTVTEELIAVSEWWRPYDKANAPKDHIKYRESSVELYADALSVLLNSPGDLQAMAPEFWRGFMEYVDKKPEFLNAFLELQSILAGDDATVAARRRENIQAMFDNGDQKILASLTAARAARMSIIDTVKQFLGQYLLNSRQPINTRVAKVKKAGGNVRVAENAEYIMDEFFRSDNPNHVFLTDVQSEVHKPLLDEGMSRDDLGEYLFLRRVLNERNEIANPLGFNATESAKQLADLEKRLGAKQFAALEAAAKRFHELVYDVAAKATAAGYYSQSTFDNTIRPNRNNYAAFAVVKYLEDHVTPAIKQQVGTFEEIANPFDATVMKVMAVNRMIELNNAKVAVRDLLLREFPQEAIPTPIPYRQREPAKPAPDGMEYVIVFEDGKPRAYAVPKEIATSFKSHDVGRLAHMGVVVQSIVYKIFHPLYVSLAPGFQAANPFKDLRRTLVNLPAAAKAKGINITMAEIIEEYVKAMPESKRRALGIDDALLREMMQTKALDTPFAEMDLEDADKGQYQRLLEKHGIAEAEAKSQVGRALQIMGNMVEGVGVFQETITKVAAYKLLTKKGLGAREAAHIVRKYVGTPDYKQRGLATAVTNSIWMYSKVKWNGLQADAHLAFNPKTAAGWWWRAMAINVIPTWTYRAALGGLFGSAIAAMFQRIPKYFLDSYDCIPIGWVFAPGDEEEPDAGKVAFFTIPKDETGRLLSALGGSMYDVAAELAGSDSKSGSTHKALAEAGRELQAAVLPDMNPAFDIIWKWSQFGAGVNPVDHTGRQIVPRDEWTAGGWDASKMMLTWTSDKFGVISDLMKWAGRDNVLPSRFRGASGAEENAPWYTTIPGLSRLMRTSDYGLREDEWTDIENDEQERARFRLGLGKEIRGATSERYALSRQDKFGLDDKRSLRLFHLNSWYAHTYLPLVDEIRDLEADGKDAADLRKKLDEDTATALMPEPDMTKPEERKKYLDVHGQSIGSTLMDATSPRPEREKTESGTQFGERKARWTTRTADAKKLIELLDLTYDEKRKLHEDEAKRRGNGTKRWEGEYRNRRTDFGRREAKLKTLSP